MQRKIRLASCISIFPRKKYFPLTHARNSNEDSALVDAQWSSTMNLTSDISEQSLRKKKKIEKKKKKKSASDIPDAGKPVALVLAG